MAASASLVHRDLERSTHCHFARGERAPGRGDGRRSRAAIESDRTLAGKCSTLIVEDMISIRPLSIGDAAYLTCEFNLSIHA